jgi:hypothetical protein
MTDWPKRVLVGSLLGAAIGVLIGLGLARLLWPTAEPAPTALPLPTAIAVTEPEESADQPLVLVSALYAVDGDLDRAQERLTVLFLDDPPQALADLAMRYGSSGSSKVATDLATLAAALGYRSQELVAYVATPTATATNTPIPTPVPPTLTLSPTATPMPTPSPSPTPLPSVTRRPAATRLPAPTNTPGSTSRPLEWDPQVYSLDTPIKLVPAEVAPGQLYWRLVRLDWRKPGEEGSGNCIIYISTFKQDDQLKWGQEVVVENGGHTVLYTDPKPGHPYGAEFVMGSTLNSYIVFVGGEYPSERVTGLGLGVWLGGLDHTSWILEFQLARK